MEGTPGEALVMVEVRVALDVLAEQVTVKVPEPIPVVGESTHQIWSLSAVQSHPSVAETAKEKELPGEGK